MQIYRETCFVIAAKDRPGEVARVTACLMKAEVYLKGIWGFGMGQGSAQVIAVPEDVSAFHVAAQKEDWRAEEHVCFRLEGEDTTGALVDILEKIAAEKINLHAVDAIAVEGSFGCYLWGGDSEVELIAQVLGLSTPLG